MIQCMCGGEMQEHSPSQGELWWICGGCGHAVLADPETTMAQAMDSLAELYRDVPQPEGYARVPDGYPPQRLVSCEADGIRHTHPDTETCQVCEGMEPRDLAEPPCDVEGH